MEEGRGRGVSGRGWRGARMDVRAWRRALPVRVQVSTMWVEVSTSARLSLLVAAAAVVVVEEGEERYGGEEEGGEGEGAGVAGAGAGTGGTAAGSPWIAWTRCLPRPPTTHT